MYTDPTNRIAAGLGNYVETVARCLGEEALTTDYEANEDLAIAIIMVASRLPTITDRPLLLSWDEVNGWALRIQINDNGETIALSYLGGDVLPEAGDVRQFLEDAALGNHPGSISPPGFRHPNDQDNLERRLSHFG
ncbi:hypothetical protein DFQ14_104189 [Halopolyspora algeriensis]|uniref:DUF6292 domain-containing protein n=1 Tax=Halopolyspora algeriensis TaxID=1500506 RepID=A0A368VRS5_9ACTN|nr:DUF6292 family protein [Halopolyspora algeriensis]RCW44600.1 hypothetical protein DFQ14_104189 [Halopolyspora algeriensis]TQM55961.1 hypothetical protein FHU43_0739 [Halopolyspora algeriensis]